MIINDSGSNWIRERLTRRRAWIAIAFIVTWNLVAGGLFVRLLLAEDAPLSIVVPQVVIGVVFVAAFSIWLLRNSQPPEQR